MSFVHFGLSLEVRQTKYDEILSGGTNMDYSYLMFTNFC